MPPTSALFEAVRRRAKIPPRPETSALMALAQTLQARGFTPSYGPGDHGNLSCRTPEGCLITARETRKAALQAADLAQVVGYTRGSEGIRVRYDGRALPSTDTIMHLEIYAARPDVGAIVHGHDARLLDRARALGIPVTRVSGAVSSLALINEIAALAARHDFLITRDHGFLALGASLAAAAACLERWSALSTVSDTSSGTTLAGI